MASVRLVATHFVLSRVILLHYDINGDAVVLNVAVNGRAVGQFTDMLADHPRSTRSSWAT